MDTDGHDGTTGRTRPDGRDGRTDATDGCDRRTDATDGWMRKKEEATDRRTDGLM